MEVGERFGEGFGPGVGVWGGGRGGHADEGMEGSATEDEAGDGHRLLGE